MGSSEETGASDSEDVDSLDKLHWWQKASIYQVLIQSFQDTNGDGKGDLRGIMERLDYFVTLGVDVIWISPIYESPMCDMGYDISDYRKVNPVFGTMEDLELLVQETHHRGLKIILDIALNHTADTVSSQDDLGISADDVGNVSMNGSKPPGALARILISESGIGISGAQERETSKANRSHQITGKALSPVGYAH